MYDQTAVHLAAGSGQLECLRLLLEHGGSHECKDNEKKSPLDYAEKEGHTLCKSLLTKHSGKCASKMQCHFPKQFNCP